MLPLLLWTNMWIRLRMTATMDLWMTWFGRSGNIYKKKSNRKHSRKQNTSFRIGSTTRSHRLRLKELKKQPFFRSATGQFSHSLENWQKSYQNGEYIRCAESGEEANYNMVDGLHNNRWKRTPAWKTTGMWTEERESFLNRSCHRSWWTPPLGAAAHPGWKEPTSK